MNNKKNAVLFVCILIITIISVSLFNYIVDPYYIFNSPSIKGFNNVKTYKYANKRSLLYTDLRVNNKSKNSAFVGNCLISRYEGVKDNIAFYIIPMATIDEVNIIIKNIIKTAPQIKKLYWGFMLQDLWYEENEEVPDVLPDFKTKNITPEDIVTLFFSWNTTKFSLLTVFDSIKNSGKDIVYIYPYKEIAENNYVNADKASSLDKVKEAIDIANRNGIEVIVYHSPNNITKKIHLMHHNLWDRNLEFKKGLAEITPFIDYSSSNQYNDELLDSHSKYYIDNIHPTDIYNNMILNDVMSDNHTVGKLITKDNVDAYNAEETYHLIEYMENHKDLSLKIKNLKSEDINVKIRKSDDAV